jgi:hypothetical protein|tara:strand:- start:1539 stop:1871 length:333 start_codon:yes stop_codon:yes gene_type:complete
MTPILKSLTGSTTTALISPGDNAKMINTIHITNTHATDEVLVDLFIGKLSNTNYQFSSSSTYLIKGHKIIKGGYFSLNSNVLNFDSSDDGFGLFIKLNKSTSSVDILMNK